MKLGEKEGCVFKDRIDLELTPFQIKRLIKVAQEDAMKEKVYNSVQPKRDLKDYLQKRYDLWKKQRDNLVRVEENNE